MLLGISEELILYEKCIHLFASITPFGCLCKDGGKSKHLICFLKSLWVLQTSGGCSAYYFGFLKAKPYFDVGVSEALHT